MKLDSFEGSALFAIEVTVISDDDKKIRSFSLYQTKILKNSKSKIFSNNFFGDSQRNSHKKIDF